MATRKHAWAAFWLLYGVWFVLCAAGLEKEHRAVRDAALIVDMVLFIVLAWTRKRS